MKLHRIFIENLPENAEESTINSIFSKFGTVSSTEIKQRKNVTYKHSSSLFCYVNLNSDDSQLQKCFQYFNQNQWLGQYVKLQIAKESFLERLKREREAQPTNLNGTEDAKPKSVEKSELKNDIKKSSYNSHEELNVKVTPKVVEEDSSTSSSSEDEISQENHQNNRVTEKDVEGITPDLIIKNNRNKKLVTDKLKIESVGREPIIIDNSKVKPRSLDKFRSEADNKRMGSILERRKAYNQKQNAIQAALSYSSTNNNRKIIFDVDDNIETERDVKDHRLVNSKKSLFDETDSEEDEDPNRVFEVKEQFQGKAGEKLLKLQSTFKNDKRFILDEKFLESEEPAQNHEQKTVDDIGQEKQEEFRILGEILGCDIKSKNQEKQRIGTDIEIKTMKRFDPNQPDHLKYELKKEEKKSKSKKKDEVVFLDKKVDDKEEPEVSKEVFYSVKDDLKKSLQEDKGFSLLSMFGTVKEKVDEPSDNSAIPMKKKKIDSGENPFKYDSSDDEDETEDLARTEKNEIDNKRTENSVRAWTEPFFFQEDDFRLQEGMDFAKRIATEEKEDFGQVRRNLKEIARNKIRSNLRKNRPFKKKLGGNKKKKMKRMNKALKR